MALVASAKTKNLKAKYIFCRVFWLIIRGPNWFSLYSKHLIEY